MAFGLAGDDALEDICEPGLQVYIVELRGIDERSEDCPRVCPVFAAREEPITIDAPASQAETPLFSTGARLSSA
jgi:hypothetical protein